jgi:1,4-dihydroxy-2-naphthoyl-CoA hydrolase
MSDAPEDFAPMLNARLDGWNTAMQLRFVRASRDEVVAEWTVGPQHLQAYGIVHGGVHAGVIETVASVGAALDAMPRGQSVVGLDNHTSFVRAVREGALRVTARPITRGRRTQLWEATVTDAEARVVATGRVRLLALEADAALAGAAPSVKAALAP